MSLLFAAHRMLSLARAIAPTCARAQHTAVPPPPPLSSPPTAAEAAAARAWLAAFARAPLPRADVALSFARSAGPGGQHVNKTNSKAEARVALDCAWIPRWARPALARSSAYAASSRSLRVAAMAHRSQAQNVAACFAKLHALIHAACAAAVPRPVDPARIARKAAHERAEKARRRTSKVARAAVKGGRRAPGGGWE